MSDKQKIIETISNINEDATFEEIIYQLYLQYRIEKGLDDIDNGKVLSSEEIYDEIDKW